jgi:hypothetical protein
VGSDKIQNFKPVFEEFIVIREWEDEISYDEDKDEWAISTGLNIGDQQGKLFIEGRDSTGIFGIFIYYDVKCKEAKLKETAAVCNWINPQLLLGSFQCFSDGRIRWAQRFDCEGAVMSGAVVSNNFGEGWNTTGRYVDLLLSVALTKLSAEDAIQEFVDAQAAAEDDAGPSEL